MTFNKNDIKSMYSESYPIYPDLWGGKTATRCLQAILEYKS